MARLYYTCPIQALYMKQEFGVKFQSDDKDTNYYVAKESEHIFVESRNWDLKNENTNEIIMRDGKHFFMPEVENDD